MPSSPWADGGSALPGAVLARCLLASLSRGAVHGAAVPTTLYVAHSQPAPADPRARLAELASVCRLWAAALRDCGDEAWQARCVEAFFLPRQLPQAPWPWGGALGPRVDDLVLYRRRERGRVLERHEHGGGEASFAVQLLASGRTRETEAQHLSPAAPWRRLFCALTQHAGRELEEHPAAAALQPGVAAGAGAFGALQFGALVVPLDFHLRTPYSAAQLAAWEAAVEAARDSHAAALLAALRRDDTRGVCAELFRLRCAWSQANELEHARQESARRERERLEARARAAQRGVPLAPTRSASARERERGIEAVAAVAAELEQLRAAGQSVELDMRDAFVRGLRRGSRLAEWRAELSRMTTELASLQARLDAMAAQQSRSCIGDDLATVAEARKAANAQVGVYLEGVSRWTATCNALQQLFEDLLLLPRGPPRTS